MYGMSFSLIRIMPSWEAGSSTLKLNIDTSDLALLLPGYETVGCLKKYHALFTQLYESGAEQSQAQDKLSFTMQY